MGTPTTVAKAFPEKNPRVRNGDRGRGDEQQSSFGDYDQRRDEKSRVVDDERRQECP